MKGSSGFLLGVLILALGIQEVDSTQRPSELSREDSVTGQVEPLIEQALASARAGDDETTHALIQRAIQLAKGEDTSPREAVAALNRFSERMWHASYLGPGRTLADAALEIAERTDPDSLGVASSLVNISVVLIYRGEVAAAVEHLRRALGIQEELDPGSATVAKSLNALANAVLAQGKLDEAASHFRRALAIQEELEPGSRAVASMLYGLGRVASQAGDLDAAESYHRRALEIRQSLEPGAPGVAASLDAIGVIHVRRGDLPTAIEYLQQALAVQEKQAPDSLQVASSLNNLGAVSSRQGDLEKARDYHERSLRIRRKVAPGSLDVAASLNNLGNIAKRQGNLRSARDYYSRSLEIVERKASGSLSLANALNNLGALAEELGDFEAAWSYHQRALTIREEKAPGSLDVATSLTNAGIVARALGNPEVAEDHHRRALEIRERLAPGSMQVASSLGNLANVLGDQGRFNAAVELYEKGLAIREKHAPGSLDVASSLHNLGAMAAKQDNHEKAAGYFREALEIRARHAPGSLNVAESLRALGVTSGRLGDPGRAEELLARAWGIVRGHAASVVGDESWQAYAAAHVGYATDLIGARVELGDKAGALVVLEESRSQGLLELFARRGLDQAVPGELWAAYKRAEMDRDQRGEQLAALGARISRLEREVEAGLPSESDGLVSVRQDYEEARTSYVTSRVEAERQLDLVKASVPGLEPGVRSLEQARGALPAGTVYLAYALGEEAGWVFVIPPERVQAARIERIELGIDALSERIASFREELGVRSFVRGIGGVAKVSENDSLLESSRSLFELLFPAVAREAISEVDRVIISPDGPLWELPFAALATRDMGDPQWLGLDKRLSYVPSMSVLAELGDRNSRAADRDVVIVGDPKIDLSTRTPDQDAVRRLLPPEATGFGPLPGARLEAVQLAELYGTTPILGEAATEAAVRSRLVEATVAHLATHGYFHPSRPMSSGVLLAHARGASGSSDDGALQAWEILGGLRLRADLVVLSACESGRGRAVRGEGLVGLTRALQAAGARSVVATHWKVTDEASGELMVAFHRHLLKGRPKDEALRLAMKETADEKTTAHPYYWAPFFLTGKAD